MSITNSSEKKVNDFPKIMSCTEGQVVMFHEDGEGTVIVSTVARHPIGYYSKRWYMDNFTDYNKPVTIKNTES